VNKYSCFAIKVEGVDNSVRSIKTFGPCVMLHSKYDCMKESNLVVIVSEDTYNESDHESYEFQIQSLGPCRANCVAPSIETSVIGIYPNLFSELDIPVPTSIWEGMCLTLDDYYYKRDNFFPVPFSLFVFSYTKGKVVQASQRNSTHRTMTLAMWI